LGHNWAAFKNIEKKGGGRGSNEKKQIRTTKTSSGFWNQ